MRRVVREGEIDHRPGEGGLPSHRVAVDVEAVRLVLDVAQAGEVHRVERRRGDLRDASAQGLGELAIGDDGALGEAVGPGPLPDDAVEAEDFPRLQQRVVDELGGAADVDVAVLRVREVGGELPHHAPDPELADVGDPPLGPPRLESDGDAAVLAGRSERGQQPAGERALRDRTAAVAGHDDGPTVADAYGRVAGGTGEFRKAGTGERVQPRGVQPQLQLAVRGHQAEHPPQDGRGQLDGSPTGAHEDRCGHGGPSELGDGRVDHLLGDLRLHLLGGQHDLAGAAHRRPRLGEGVRRRLLVNGAPAHRRLSDHLRAGERHLSILRRPLEAVSQPLDGRA